MKNKSLIQIVISLILSSFVFLLPSSALASSISPSAGGSHFVGDTFTVNVVASGASFDAFHGVINVSGPLSVVSLTPGSALWATSPAVGSAFDGALKTATTSFTIASLKLKGTAPGTGSVSVSGVRLVSNGVQIDNGGGSTSVTINRVLVPAGGITVTSTTHPDQAASYEATTVSLAWNKPAGVTGFSYVFDQAAGTVPAAKSLNANTSVEYANQAIGTYYFHIRAVNGDGWGPTTNFKINIKTPDPKVNSTLAKPQITSILKSSKCTVNLADGTLSGIVLSGKNLAGYQTNLTFAPALPDGTITTATTDAKGVWTLTIAGPVKAGFYTVTAIGQQDKILTPVSDAVKFEVGLARNGAVRILTDKDTKSATTPVDSQIDPITIKSFILSYLKSPYDWASLTIIVLAIVGLYVNHHLKLRRGK